VTAALAQALLHPIPHVPLVFGPVAPELILVGTAVVVMMLDALQPRVGPHALAAVSLAGILGAIGYSASLWSWNGAPVVLGGMVEADRFAVFFRFVLLGVAALAVLLSQHYLDRADEARGEYYPLLLFATAGMTLIAAAGDLILVFLSLEILSLALYLLTGFSFRRMASAEGAMKYFLLGAFSSAFFLYGIALAYGATGTTSLSGIGHALAGGAVAAHGATALAVLAAGLLAIGLCFKVAAVPFHMWTPDAYQGAPTSVTAFMSAGTKVAAFAAFLRVFTVALGPLSLDWRPFLAIISAVTMVAGSVLAIAQTDVKRMFAYSSIAHAGFILTGVSAASAAGVQASMFYLVAYAAMILGGFGAVMLVSIRGERNLSLASYRGLARRSPFLGGVLALFLLSLAGIPPTAGFIAKVVVFSAAIRSGYWWLALVAVLSSVIAAFFYLRVIVLMYMQEPEEVLISGAEGGPFVFERAPLARLAVAVPAALTLAAGVFPSIVFDALRTASVVRF